MKSPSYKKISVLCTSLFNSAEFVFNQTVIFVLGQQSPVSSESATTARASSVGDTHVLSKNISNTLRRDHVYRSSDEEEMNASPTNDNVMFKEKKDYLNLGFSFDHSPVETTTEL
nr:uncharacterized protein LOC111516959 [Leptinotarsa decemlineata]